jgi:hypothetical protein
MAPWQSLLIEERGTLTTGKPMAPGSFPTGAARNTLKAGDKSRDGLGKAASGIVRVPCDFELPVRSSVGSPRTCPDRHEERMDESMPTVNNYDYNKSTQVVAVATDHLILSHRMPPTRVTAVLSARNAGCALTK